MRRLLLLGCLLGFVLVGAAGCGKDSKPTEQTPPRAPRLPKPKDINQNKDQGQKP